MKKIALFLLIIAILMGAVTIWGFYGMHLDVQAENVQILAYEQFPQEFHRIANLLSHSAVRGVVYDSQLDGSIHDYVILEYTIIFKNNGLLPAQMLEAQIVPIKGDVLCYSQQEARGQDVNLSLDVRPGQEVRLRCYLLTKKELHAVRDIQTSYYVWGTPFLITVKYG